MGSASRSRWFASSSDSIDARNRTADDLNHLFFAAPPTCANWAEAARARLTEEERAAESAVEARRQLIGKA